MDLFLILEHKYCLANSEGPDEMPHKVAFYQGLHCLLRQKQSSGTDVHLFIEILTGHSLNYKMEKFHTYCVNIFGKIHYNEKG